MAHIITVTSGKGGVGKTSISLNLSLALADKGFKVCLFDADLGLANVSILTGIYPKRDLESVIFGQHGIKDIIISNYQGIDIIPGSNGVEKLADLTRTQTATLISTFLDLEEYDFFIFDTSAGISSQVISFCMASHEIILAATTEPTSLTDAYSMLKVLSKYQYNGPVKVVINQVKKGRTAQKAYNQLKKTADKFLSISLMPLGIVAADKNVRTAVVSQTPFYMMFPQSLASRCINSIADKVLDSQIKKTDIPMEIFWSKCLSFLEKYQSRENPDDAAASRNKPADTFKPLGDKKSLEKIEEKLSALMNEILDIKQILASHNVYPKYQKSFSTYDSSPDSNVVAFESRMDRYISDYEDSRPVIPTKERQEAIARGKLRSPTDEELANWNEYDDPIVRKPADTM